MSLNKLKPVFISTISDNPSTVFSNLELFEKSGVGGIHFDVMDGVFVPRLGLYPELLQEISRKTSLSIEVHVMLFEPFKYLKLLVESGANRVIFHLECGENIDYLIGSAKDLGIEVGLALNPETEIDRIKQYISKIDSVMLMAIRPGIPKHPMIETTFDKLRSLKEMIDNSPGELMIQIDGGVTFENVPRLLSSGASHVVCGSGTVFSPTGTVLQNLTKLEHALSSN